MKKTILVIAVVASITLIGTQAFACYWDGYWGGPMGGPMAGAHGTTYQGFYDQTSQLRQDLAGKQGEYNALMAKSNPDPKLFRGYGPWRGQQGWLWRRSLSAGGS